MISKFLKVFVLYTALSASALAGTQSGKVTKVFIRASDGLVYFFVEGTGTGKPACASAGYWIIKDENSSAGKRQLAALLTARASGEAVTISGMNTCTRWHDGEDVEEILL